MLSSPSASAERPAAPPAAARPRCLLSVDLEEWADARLAGIPPGARDGYAPSLDRPVGRLLELLERHRARATFFTLGRVARRYPDLVRRIAKRHEIASHGESHTDLRRLDRRRLAAEIAASRATLQDLSGQEVMGYRAPNWSLAAVLDWALPVLEEEGIAYDSSLVPGPGALFVPGCAGAPTRPFRIGGGSMWEFPPTVLSLSGLASAPVGGTLLRLLPAGWTARVLEEAGRRGELPHLHLHPWEMEPRPAQCRVDAARGALLFAGAAGVAGKLETLVARFETIAIEQAWREARAGGGPRAVSGPRGGTGPRLLAGPRGAGGEPAMAAAS